MAINLPTAPEAGLELARTNVPILIDQDGTIDQFEIASADLDVALPHPIYVTTAQDFVDDQVLANARLKGWQYVLLTGERVRASAEGGHADKPADMMFTVLRYRSYALPISRALRAP